LPHHPDHVGELFGFGQIVGAAQYRPALGAEARDQCSDLAGAGGVESRRRLVEKDHPRLVQHRANQRETLLHSLRPGAERTFPRTPELEIRLPADLVVEPRRFGEEANARPQHRAGFL